MGELTGFRSSVAARLKKGTGPFEYSTGARNEVSILTPNVSTAGIQGYLSLSPVFFVLMVLIFTFGGLIEFQRFFPDALYWWSWSLCGCGACCSVSAGVNGSGGFES